MIPPIRYPLPSLVALIIVSLGAWKGEAWTRDARSALAVRLRRAVEGPPIPSSTRPQSIDGPVTRRALLLRDSTPASARPGGRTVESIEGRRFVEVYDAWPTSGPATHLRVGNRSPIGWVAIGDVLAWDTRLVIVSTAGGLPLAPSAEASADFRIEPGATCPILGWTDRAIEVAVWDRDPPWARVARRGWIPISEIPAEAWAIWISDVELPIALRLSFGDEGSSGRTLSALGHLVDGQAWSKQDLAAARNALPPWWPKVAVDPKKARERLAEANASPKSDASWGGFSFRALPQEDFP